MKMTVKCFAFVLAAVMMFSCFAGLSVPVFAEQSDIFIYLVEGSDIILTGIDSSAAGDIVVPQTIDGKNITVVQGAFKNNSRITSVVLPDTVTVITAESFNRCVNLKSVTLPANLVRIDERAFYACESLESIEMPDTVATLGANAFSWCSKLKDVTLSKGIGFIDVGTFTGCSELEEIDIPDNINYIANDSFSQTKFYTTASNWEDDVLYLGKHIIAAKSTVSGRYEIKAGTKSVSNLAFVNCTGLKELVIYEGLKKIGGDAFLGCSNLKDVFYTGTIEQRRTIDIGKNNYPIKEAAVWHYEYDPAVKEYYPGDINGDDAINNKDLIRLFQYVSDWEVDVIETVIDVNGDKKINNKDVIRLFQYLSGWDVKIYSVSTNYDPIGDDIGPVVSF